MRQQNFSSLFSVFDALSGFSAFVVVVNLILIGGRSIKPVPISNPLAPLPSLSCSSSSIHTLQLQFRFLCCLSSASVCVWCVVAGFSLIFCVLCALCCPSTLPAPPLLLQLLTIVVQGHFANVFVFISLLSSLFFYQLGKHSAPTVHSVAKTALRPPLRCN